MNYHFSPQFLTHWPISIPIYNSLRRIAGSNKLKKAARRNSTSAGSTALNRKNCHVDIAPNHLSSQPLVSKESETSAGCSTTSTNSAECHYHFKNGPNDSCCGNSVDVNAISGNESGDAAVGEVKEGKTLQTNEVFENQTEKEIPSLNIAGQMGPSNSVIHNELEVSASKNINRQPKATFKRGFSLNIFKADGWAYTSKDGINGENSSTEDSESADEAIIKPFIAKNKSVRSAYEHSALHSHYEMGPIIHRSARSIITEATLKNRKRNNLLIEAAPVTELATTHPSYVIKVVRLKQKKDGKKKFSLDPSIKFTVLKPLVNGTSDIQEMIDISEFQRELKYYQFCKHPYIAKLQDWAIYKTFGFMVMPRYESSLETAEIRHWDTIDIEKIMAQLLSAINYMHMMNICHRNIQLKTIYFSTINRQPFIALSSFELATICHFSTLGLSQVCGSNQFMAPECFSGSYGRNVDIWSAGAVLYYITYGTTPLEAKHHCPISASPEKHKLTVLRQKVQASSMQLSVYFGAYDARGKLVHTDQRDLMERLLSTDPEGRITAADALEHPFIARLLPSLSPNNEH